MDLTLILSVAAAALIGVFVGYLGEQPKIKKLRSALRISVKYNEHLETELDHLRKQRTR